MSNQDLTVESKSHNTFQESKNVSGIASALDKTELSELDKKRASCNS